jgi:uncharacterized protein (TIGR02284 family)
MNNQDIVSQLNDLIETCKNGEYGFQTCAEHAQSNELQALFRSRAIECRDSAGVLQSYVLQYGGNPEVDGTAAGALHRGWMNLRSKLTDSTDLVLLNECERAEYQALASYRKAVAKDLPPLIATEVDRQLRGVQANHDQIKLLRDRERAAERASI